MNDDFTSKLQQLKDMLNNGQLQDNIANMASLMSSDTSQDSNASSGSHNENPKVSSDKEIMINKLKKIMDMSNQPNDPRINLLNAIKPYLNQKRQSRIGSYTKMLNYTQLSRLLKEVEL